MNPSPISRRHWLGAGLATCGYLAAAHGSVLAATTVAPAYTKPGPETRRGLAPGLQARVLHQSPTGETTYALVFAKGDEVLSGLTEWAEREKIQAAQISGIGAFQRALFGWFDAEQKAYRDIAVDRQVEVCSLLGDIGLVAGKPQVHVHGVIGLPTGETRGGHLLEAHVWPTLEVFLTAWPDPLVKEHDDETGLALFDLHPHANH